MKLFLPILILFFSISSFGAFSFQNKVNCHWADTSKSFVLEKVGADGKRTIYFARSNKRENSDCVTSKYEVKCKTPMSLHIKITAKSISPQNENADSADYTFTTTDRSSDSVVNCSQERTRKASNSNSKTGSSSNPTSTSDGW